MIAKFAINFGQVASEFRDLNRASRNKFLVSLLMPKVALDTGRDFWRPSASGH
jgi:hypothetical protein